MDSESYSEAMTDRKWFRSKSSGRLIRSSSYSSSGISEVNLTTIEDTVFLNEEWLKNCSRNLGQVIVVDSGCPRSLMGNEELRKLKQTVEVQECNVRDERFRFGPSRVYTARRKVKFAMRVGINETDCEFFVSYSPW